MHQPQLNLIVTTAALAAAAILPIPMLGQDSGSGAYSQRDRAQSLRRDVSFVDPPEILAAESAATGTLRVYEAVNQINGVQLRHRCYNGGLVGPTIRVRAGQSLKLLLQNDLQPEPGGGHASNVPHGFNITNLHTHGLHVSPESPADDVFREVGPGECFEYEFVLPPDHPAGTFWYHAHKHGSTALQLASGMSGALIVTGGADEINEIRVAEEKVMVLQQFTYTQQQGESASVDAGGLYYGTGDGDIVTAINGVVTPTIVMRPGEVQRWRLIHAGTSEVISLDIEGIDFYEIAVDGLTTGKIKKTNRLTLFPGYRSDVLVKAPLSVGRRLMYTKVRDADKSLRNELSERTNLLRIVVDGTPNDMALPTDEQLAVVAPFTDADVPPDDRIAHRRVLRFSQDGTTEFLIDGRKFDPQTISHLPELNTAEEWELISTSGVHPFHIHVNPFAVKPAEPDDPWIWRDTVVLRRGRPVTIRIRYTEFTGKTVLHCHNLVHEDWGMMQAIKIVDPADDAETPRLTAAPPWEALDSWGVRHSSDQYQGRRTLLVFHRGMECMHCAEQMQTLKQQSARFESLGIQLIAISPHLPGDPEVVQTLAEFPFPILVDADLTSFRRYRCMNDQAEPLHGLFLIDSANQIVSATRTETAVADPATFVSETSAFLLQGK